MANRIEILVEVDPSGRGSARIKTIGREVEDLERKSSQAGARGASAVSGILGGFGVPLTAAAGVLILKDAINTANEGENAGRRLAASSKEAGLQIAFARGESAKLAEELALSQTQADGATAKLIQLARVSGKLGDLGDIRRKFADLAAAYGMTADEIETLTNQLLSGQDEALNRLGIADPSKLYREYGKEIGKAANELTQQEQAQARLNAVLEKGEKHLGAANERLTTQAGKWAELTANISDARRALGEWAGERGLALIRTLTPGYDYQKDEDARQRALANEERRMREEALAKSLAKERRVSIQNELAGALNASVRSGDYGDFSKVEFRDFETLAVSRGEEAATKFRSAFTGRLSSLFKESDPDANVVLFAEREFRELRGILDKEEATKFAKEFDKYFERIHKTAAGYLKGVRGEAEKLFDTLAERYAGEGSNPFVKIFAEAQERAKALQKTFGVLGDEVVKELQEIEAAHTKQQTLALQLDNELAAATLRRQALTDREQASIRELTRLDEARLQVLEKQINAAREIPELEAKAAALRGGRANEQGLVIDQARIQGQEFARLREELQAAQNLGGLVGIEAVTRVNRELVDLFNELPPEVQAAIARGRAPGRAEFAGAFESEANARRRAVREEQERAAREGREFGRDQALSKERLDRIREAELQGLNAADVDKRILGLDREGLGSQGLRARAGAGEREADRLFNAQETARKAVEQATATQERLINATDKLAAAMQDPDNRKLLIDINNRSKADVREELYGSLKPAPASSSRE